MNNKEELQKHILSSKLMGTVPTNIDKSVKIIAELSLERIVLGWFVKNVWVAIHTFSLNKIVDDSMLKQVYDSIIEMHVPVKNVADTIIISSIKWPFTLIPELYFSADQIDQVLNTQYLTTNTTVGSYDKPEGDIVILYHKPIEWQHAFKCRHAVSGLLQKLTKTAIGNESAVWACLYSGGIILIFSIENKIQFCNAFEPSSTYDYIYYIMLVYNQLRLNPAHTPLKFIGEIEINAPLLETANRYIKNVAFGTYDINNHIDKSLLDVPRHYYYTLLATAECVL